jgi:hypothetical protein
VKISADLKIGDFAVDLNSNFKAYIDCLYFYFICLKIDYTADYYSMKIDYWQITADCCYYIVDYLSIDIDYYYYWKIGYCYFFVDCYYLITFIGFCLWLNY